MPLLPGGLIPGFTYRFTSILKPDHMLRHKDGKLHMEPSDGSELFIQDTSFRIDHGLAGSGISFESVNRYFQHKEGVIVHEGISGKLADASFTVHDSFSGEPGAVSFQSVNLMGQWIKGTDTNVVLSHHRNSLAFLKGTSWRATSKYRSFIDVIDPSYHSLSIKSIEEPHCSHTH